MTALTVVDVYPGSMFPQGDGGNLRMLEHRARARGIEVTTVGAPIGDPLPEGDIYVLAGAEDEDQPVVARRLAEEGTLARAAAAGKVVVGIGAGYQILGESFDTPDGVTTPGPRPARRADDAGRPRRQPRRHAALARGSACRRSSATSGTAGARRSAPGRAPLAEVEVGVCNGGDPPTDGAVQGHVLGTYLHGPLLPRNPELADLLLGWALGTELAPLESEFADLARRGAHRRGARDRAATGTASSAGAARRA